MTQQLSPHCTATTLFDLGLVDDDTHALWKGAPALHPEVREGLRAWRDQLPPLPAPTTIDDMLRAKRKPKLKRRLDDLRLFASDEEISEVLMGPGKTKEWLAILPLLERRGFPSIDGLLGGRYMPAVKAFFDREYKIHGELQVHEPHRKAELGTWQGKRHRD